MRSALVFGGSGQLGVAVAEHLLASGWEVCVATRDGRPLATSLSDGGAKRLDGTGRSRAEVIRSLRMPVDAVFDPTAYAEGDAYDLLQARDSCGALVVVSSASVYCDAQGRSLESAEETGFPDFPGPLAEGAATVEPGPQSYSRRKVAMEQALLASGALVSILRPCAIYGRRASHPREWWFIKRALDGREAIPVAYGARSVFHTSSASGIGSLAVLCMESPGARVLNVADPVALSVAEIASALSQATGLALSLRPFEGPPVGPAHVGSTPWSVGRPFVLDISQAVALGWDPGDGYAAEAESVCRWILKVARAGDWRECFTRFAHYGYDPFDYVAEERVMAAA